MAHSRVERALWCAASVVMVALLCVVASRLLPAPAGAAEAAVAANPLRVSIVPAVGALGGGPLGPGDVRYRPVAVRNDGTVPFRYRLAVTTTGGRLADHLRMEVRVAGSCGAAAFGAATVTVAGPAPLSGLDASAARRLAPGAADTLCVRLELPADAPPTVDGEQMDAVLRVAARQA